jgi:hypothetical protein
VESAVDVLVASALAVAVLAVAALGVAVLGVAVPGVAERALALVPLVGARAKGRKSSLYLRGYWV